MGREVILYTEEPSSRASDLAEEADEILSELAAYLRLDVPRAGLLKIYLYPGRWNLWRHLNRHVPALRWRRAACYEAEEAYVIALSGDPATADFERLLRHELTHYLLAVHYAFIPPWIDEGLAQITAFGPPYPHLDEACLAEARRTARARGEEACLRLLLTPPGRPLDPSGYRIALALTHELLLRSDGDPARVLRYLERTGSSVPPRRPLKKSYWEAGEKVPYARRARSRVLRRTYRTPQGRGMSGTQQMGLSLQPPRQVFLEAWGLGMDEACAAVCRDEK